MKKILILFILCPMLMVANTNSNLHCKITPEIYQYSDIPEYFNSYNTLQRKIGLPFVADGRVITIKGILTDENCVPIQGAIISMWNFNAYGKYQYDDFNDQDPGIDKNFAGTGTMITNNLGEFDFITIFPGEYTNKPPFINFQVKHDDFISFDTRLFFSNKHPDLKIFDPKIAQRLVAKKTSNDEYEFNMTLVGTNNYLRY